MQLPSLRGRSVLITGANTGIGRATAVALARAGAALYLAGRSEDRHQEVLREVRAAGVTVQYLELNLAELSSVRACAAHFLGLGAPLHLLINNAGAVGSRGTTRDGFERTFGINHLGHFLLTELLLERLKSSAPARIVNVSSKAHRKVQRIEWDRLQGPTRSLSGFPEYAVSKLCNILHAAELGQRLTGSGVSTYSLHPGVIATDIWRHLPGPIRKAILPFMRSSADGARTTLFCATAPAAAAQTGLYYDKSRPVPPSTLARDMGLAEQLADTSRAWVGLGDGS